jgi:methionyl-tRNA formyltransferase
MEEKEADLKKVSKKIVIFGHGHITKICIRKFLELGNEVLLCCPKEKLGLFNSYKLSKLDIDFEIYSDFNDEHLIKRIIDFAPDYIYSIIFSYKLPNKVIQLAKIMALNIHPSLLPEYRGSNPFFWVVRKGEKISGITVHKLTQEWDSGPIIYQKKFPLSEFETIGTYATRVEFYCGYVIEDLQKLMANEKFKAVPQTGSPYYPKVKYKDVIVDWASTAKEIELLIRACNPWPGALTYYRNLMLRILEVSWSPHSAGKPGEISIIDGNLYVSASDYMLKINIIESPKEGIFSGLRFASFCTTRSGEMFQNLAEFMKPEDLNRIVKN